MATQVASVNSVKGTISCACGHDLRLDLYHSGGRRPDMWGVFFQCLNCHRCYELTPLPRKVYKDARALPVARWEHEETAEPGGPGTEDKDDGNERTND